MPERSDEFESMTLLDTHEYEDHGEKRGKDQSLPAKMTLAMVSGLIVFFLVDIITFAYIARILIDARRQSEPDKLEFKNPYIGLDELYSLQGVKPSQYNTIVNEPRLATQISQDQPHKVFPVDLHRWLSDFGVLSPPDRNFKISSAVRLSLYTLLGADLFSTG
ncbi:hypothetical protein CVT25_009628 [Psilocybe cyanescens]|uniref:Uncharacterized protein n=1 Tax=Psilocybe cyanescens TaxID=93625 RepID=A0A409XGW0_PSICY|nr:hypothetical protein CVT25_009628 [Psilocybe cyanescens]